MSSQFDQYCDHNATSPMPPSVREAYISAIDRYWGNSFSQHQLGRDAANAIDKSRDLIAQSLHRQPKEIRFTSGATEANAWVFSSLITRDQPFALVSSVEHPSVLKHGTHHIPTDDSGLIDIKRTERFLIDMKGLIGVVSVMAANNETGVIQPISDVFELCQKHHVPFHCDATQAFLKTDMPLNADYLTISAHKFGGPKGIGVLALSKEINPMLIGGPQERDSRGGTHNTPAIVGMGAAVSHFNPCDNDVQTQIENAIVSIGGQILGQDAPRLNNTTCALFHHPGDLLVMALDINGLQASTGSACSSGASKESHVLQAMGKSGTPVRFSYDRRTDIKAVIKTLSNVIQSLEAT